VVVVGPAAARPTRRRRTGHPGMAVSAARLAALPRPTLRAYRDEGRRLAADAKAAGLVERALRGEKFTRSL
jgi:hypothetical protein